MPDQTVKIGIDEPSRLQIVEGLSRLLADTYTLALKTHNFHWNVTGPQFNSLHVMFMAQYTELYLAADLIAERIRALGAFAPGSYADYARLGRVKDAQGVPSANDMVRELLDGHETAARTARETLPLTESARDQVSADLLTQRLQVHEKTAWMLRSVIG